MKRAALLVVLASMTGAAFAQVSDRKSWMEPASDTHHPLGSDSTRDLPPADPRDEAGYRINPPPSRDYQTRRYNSDVDYEAARQREWRQRRYEADHPYQTNFGGNPYDRSGRTELGQPRRSTASPYTGTPSRSRGSTSSGGQYPQGDPNWLRPNFGSPPAPRPRPTNPYSFNTPRPRATTGLYGQPPKRCGSRSPYSFSPC